MFKSNRELEGTSIGSTLRLTSSVRVLKGEFVEGSLLTVIGEPNERGEFECRDNDSGETVFLHPTLSSYEKA